MKSNVAVPPKSQLLHPDALYDVAYEAETLELSTYRGAAPGAVTATANRVEIALGARTLRVEGAGAGLMRLRVSAPGEAIKSSVTEQFHLLTAPEPEPLEWEETKDMVTVRTASLRLRVKRGTGDLAVERADGTLLWSTAAGGLRFSTEPPEYGGQRFVLESKIAADEQFFGFGGRIAPLNRRGQTADIFSVKTGKVSGDYGGFPIPYFLSTKGYGFFLNNPWPHVYFDMGRSDPDHWWVQAPGGDCDFFLIDGPSFADIVRRYTSLTGRIPVVPRWILGLWCSSLLFNSAAQALEDAKRLRAEDYPCDVFVFDGPWRGGKDFAAMYQLRQEYPSNDMEWHPDFGDGPEMIRQLAAMGIQTSLHLNSRNFRPETADHGVEQGLLRRHGEEVVVRVNHEPAERYYGELISPRIREDMALWWTDHSDRMSGELAPGLPSRNLFGVLWNRLLTRLMEQHGKPNHLSLSRGGGIGSQRYAIPWPGDTRCGVDALADDIWFMLSAGLAGFALSSADLGGFVPRRDPLKDYPSKQAIHDEMFDDENLCRRIFHCLLFTPVPRVHNNWATLPKLPWNCPEHVRGLYRAAVQARYRLTPYLYSYILQSAQTGEPLLRPLPYYFPQDREALAATTEFLIGEWLLAAPVTEEKKNTAEVYLPAGVWTHVWSGRIFLGPGHVQVEAPLHELSGLPLFAKAGAMIPRQPVTPFLKDEPPDELDLEVFPDQEAVCFELWESATHMSVFEQTPDAKGTRVTVTNGSGKVRRVTVHLFQEQAAAKELVLQPGETDSVVLSANR